MTKKLQELCERVDLGTYTDADLQHLTELSLEDWVAVANAFAARGVVNHEPMCAGKGD